MPTLIESNYIAKIEWLGHVPASDKTIRAQAVDRIDLGFGGDKGARHEGTERESCVRVRNLYAEGTVIRNVRQLSILSAEEMAQIAAEMGRDALDPAYLGASLIVSGIPDFTHVPPSSRLQGPSGVTLTIDMENRPCNFPAREIEKDEPGHGMGFKSAAQGRRGVTAWVEHPGALTLGETLTLFVPDQRAWAP